MNMQQSRRLATSAILASVVLLGASACGSEGDTRLDQVSFGVSTNMGANNAPLAVAEAMGYFKAEGLDVTITVTGEAGIQATATGRTDIGSFTPDALLQTLAKGGPSSDLVMVYNYLRGPTSSLAVLDSSPIRSLEDFRGAVIGGSSIASANLTMSDAVLNTVGLTFPRDFGHLGVGTGAAALQALTSGKVGALSLWDTEYAAFEAAGTKLRYFTIPEQQALFSTTYFVTSEYLKKKPQAIERFGRAIAKATLFTSTNPEAALRMLYHLYPTTRGAGVSIEDQLKVDLIALTARLRILKPGDGRYGEYVPANVATWASFAHEHGMITNKIADTTAIFTNRFVDAYNDFDQDAVISDARNWSDKKD
ncbi:ABC transporter substrate-binding protein [Dactylosporangium sp. NPDC000555]|uniref:ABC transporter substrate-binding protein n=1 Tax=Dactylosporangium sp. NPDC000555 TaxID=3154260 RepID=UPI00331AFE85